MRALRDYSWSNGYSVAPTHQKVWSDALIAVNSP